MNLKKKFIIVFLLISICPLILAGGVGYYHIIKVNQLSIKEAKIDLEKLSKQLVEQKGYDVVKMIQFITKQYKQKDNFSWETLQNDPAFLTAAIQTVGKTGYSAVLMKKQNRIIAFAHPNPQLMGVDLGFIAKKSRALWKVLQGPKEGERFASGYYKWREANGKLTDKYAITIPVPDTPLMVLVTIYTNEIDAPINKMEKMLHMEQKKLFLMYNAESFAVAFIVLIFAVLFATRLAKPIIHLTEVAEKISLGELKTPIRITSTDEIGDLADALRRMQSSLTKAIQRLRRTRTRRE